MPELQGIDGDDVLAEVIDDDYLCDNGGNNQIYGSEGNDILMGNAGANYFAYYE